MNKKEKDMRILNRVREHYNTLVAAGYDVICTCLQGSQNYGLDEYTDEYWSDVDTKSIIVPSLDDIVMNKQPVSATEIIEMNPAENGGSCSEHAEVKDIRIMFETIKKMNLSYIELLYSDYIIINPKWESFIKEIFEKRDLIASFNKNQFLRCMAGMAYEKQKALCHPYPSIIDKIEKYGYDGKQLSHTVRIWEIMSRYLNGEPIAACFKTKMPELLMNYKKHLNEYDNILSKEEAIKLENIYMTTIKDLKDMNLTEKDEINIAAAELLDKVKYNIIKEKMRREILEEASFSEDLHA